MIAGVILIAVLALAYANGANDNFKGVATLFGSGTASYRRALLWATVTTFLGSLTAVFLATKLLKSFSGRGLVADSLVAQPEYAAAVALGAGLTVLLATRVGMPISTTHGLIGALAGAGWAAGSPIATDRLAAQFVAPLLFSPIAAALVTLVLYGLLHTLRVRTGIAQETCFCIGREPVEVVPVLQPAVALERVEQMTAATGTSVTCHNRYQGSFVGLEVGTTVDKLHFLSSGIVSFARGLNDTPKIAALLLVVFSAGLSAISMVGTAIAVGGLMSARRVAEVMSRKITPMNHGQGFTANLVTGTLVLISSNYGLPVSTTHVSCGALFGIGAVSGGAQPRTILTIGAAWFTTLPVAAALSASAYLVLAAVSR